LAPRARALEHLSRLWRLRASRIPRAVLIAAAAAVLLVVGALVAFGPVVRSRIGREAERRGLEVEIGGVRPGLFAVTLREVRIRSRRVAVAALELRMDEVRVELASSLSVQSVEAHGGGIVVEGELDDVAARLRELRRPSDDPHPAAAHGPAIPVSVDGLALSWKVPSGGTLSGAGIRASRDATSITLSCDRCEAKQRNVALVVTGADVELAPHGEPRRLAASTLGIAYEATHALAAAAASAARPTEITPPPLPIALSKGGATPKGNSVGPSEPVFPLPDLPGLRARIATAVSALAPRLPDGARVEIGGLSVTLDAGGEPLAFGPGTFSLTRRADRIQLAFASVDGEGAVAATSAPTERKGTPLSVDADLPIAAGEMTARLAGGPVSLAVLGVKEGMKGLTDVGRGTVSGKGLLVLSAAADALTFDGQVSLRSLSLTEPRIAPEPVRGIDFFVAARGVLESGGHLRVDDAQLDMGALHVKTHGTVEETRDHFAVSLALDVAPAACQALLDSSPQGLLPTVRLSRMSGTFDASMHLAFDTRTIDKLALDYKIGDQCKMYEVPNDLSKDRFGGTFAYRTYHPDGTIGETMTGPETSNWTNLDDISPFMIAAVLTTEDGAFYKHHGFNHSAIRSSVQANLKARRFVRGASTISMQLAKNLFLARDKALSRKIEEVILTDYLEQILRKDDMMELYLNVVEFGPDVYGVTQAAEYYFGRKPEELHLAECFFLASLLPSPIRYGNLRERGEVSETWMRHLKALMEIAARNGKITRAELEEGLKEAVLFVREGEPRPEPRKPVSSTRRDPFGAESDWRPVD
jgi:hypothetical protein